MSAVHIRESGSDEWIEGITRDSILCVGGGTGMNACPMIALLSRSNLFRSPLSVTLQVLQNLL